MSTEYALEPERSRETPPSREVLRARIEVDAPMYAAVNSRIQIDVAIRAGVKSRIPVDVVNRAVVNSHIEFDAPIHAVVKSRIPVDVAIHAVVKSRIPVDVGLSIRFGGSAATLRSALATGARRDWRTSRDRRPASPPVRHRHASAAGRHPNPQ